MPSLRFRGVQGYLLTEHPTPGGSIIQILAIEGSDCSVGDNWYVATSSENWKADLSGAKNIGSADSGACAPISPSCCTPIGSPNVPGRRDSPFPRDTDMAAENGAGAARRERRAPRRNPEPFRSHRRKKNNREPNPLASWEAAADQNPA